MHPHRTYDGRMWRAVPIVAATALLTAAPGALSEPATTRVDSGAAYAVSAYAGQMVWSKPVRGGFGLFHRSAGGVKRLGVPTSRIIVQADLGPRPAGGVRAIYRRCTKRACGIYELDLPSGREHPGPQLSAPRGCTPLAPSYFKGAIAYLVEGAHCKPALYLRMPNGRTRLVTLVHLNDLARSGGGAPYYSAPATDLDATSVAWSVADPYGPIFVSARTNPKPIRLATGDAGAEFEHQMHSPQLGDGFVYWSDLDSNVDGDRFVEQRAVAATGKRCGALETPQDVDSTAVDAGQVVYASDGYQGGSKGVFTVTGALTGTAADCP